MCILNSQLSHCYGMYYAHYHFLVSKFGLSLLLSPLKYVGLEIHSSIFFLYIESKQNWEQAQMNVRTAITECAAR